MRAFLGHVEIPARDLGRAAEFYRRVFGWRVEALDWEGHPYFTIRPPAGSTPRGKGARGFGGGLLPAAEAGFERPLAVIHLETGRLEDCLERIVAAGGAVEEPPRRVGGMGTFARFRDSEGNQMGLWRSAARDG